MPVKLRYKKLIFTLALFALFACDQKNGTSWTSFSEGLTLAEKEKKPALIFFYTEWCVYCKKMNSEIFNNPEISGYLNDNFISIKVNPEKDTGTIDIMGEKISPMRLMSYTGSRAFPTTLFFDKSKKPVTTLPGYVEPGTFLSILKFLKEECYEGGTTIDDYIKNPALCRAKKP